MLLQIDISNTKKDNLKESISFLGTFTSFDTCMSYDATNLPYQQCHFALKEIKIKCVNDCYFFLFDNQWRAIREDDQVTLDQYNITFNLIPENNPLPIDVKFSEERSPSIPPFEEISLLTPQDPLSFLYNTPAQNGLDSSKPSKTYLEQKRIKDILPFWDIQKKESRHSLLFPPENQLLNYGLSKQKTKQSKAKLIFCPNKSKTKGALGNL